jgi:hypothetical protein
VLQFEVAHPRSHDVAEHLNRHLDGPESSQYKPVDQRGSTDDDARSGFHDAFADFDSEGVVDTEPG